MARSNYRVGDSDDASAAREPDPRSPAARRFLIVAAGVGGLAFGWGALRLPWRPDAPLALLLWAVAAADTGAVVALLGSSRHSRGVLSALVVLSFAAAAVFVGAIAVTSLAMVHMFGALGWGLTVALAAIGWLLLLATLPLGVVGLRYLRRRAPDAPHADA